MRLLVKVFVTALFAITLPKQSLAANEAISPRLAEFQNAALMSKVAETFNKRPLPQDVKNALIDQARSEDKDAVQRAIAGLRPAAEFRLVVDYDRLRGVDKKERTIFVIEAIPGKPSFYILNGKEWSVPESGSIMKSISNVLKGPPGNSTRTIDHLLNLFSPDAIAADATDSAPLAIYVYQQARGDLIATATGHLQKNHPDNALIRGIGFDSTSYLHDFIQVGKMLALGKKDIQCHGGTAKGFAEIGGTQVAFEANEKAEVIVQSDNHNVRAKFIPALTDKDSEPLHMRFRESLDAFGTIKATDASRKKKEAAEDVLRKLGQMCRMGQVIPGIKLPSVCATNQIPKYDDIVMSLKSSVEASNPQMTREEAFAESMKKANELIFKKVQDHIKDRGGELAGFTKLIERFKIVRTMSGVLTACKNESCTETADDAESRSLGDRYRIPPNNPDTAYVEAIDKALNYSAQTTDGKTASIEYACEVKNSTCQDMRIVNGDKLPLNELRKASEILNRANRHLNWEVDHSSVATPLYTLRALGQCCLEQACRTAMLEKGINMKVQQGSDKSGTAR